MRHAWKIGFALFLVVYFWFGLACAAILVLVLLYPGAWHSAYMRNFYKSASRLCAAMFGFSGRMMLSTEVFFDDRFTWMRKMLDAIEPDHCIKSVWEESPYSRLSDRQIRCK